MSRPSNLGPLAPEVKQPSGLLGLGGDDTGVENLDLKQANFFQMLSLIIN